MPLFQGTQIQFLAPMLGESEGIAKEGQDRNSSKQLLLTGG